VTQLLCDHNSAHFLETFGRTGWHLNDLTIANIAIVTIAINSVPIANHCGEVYIHQLFACPGILIVASVFYKVFIIRHYQYSTIDSD